MRLLIVSNRLPVKVIRSGSRTRYEASAGGLASGLNAYVNGARKKDKSLSGIRWIGWPGGMPDDKKKVERELLESHNAHCVFLSQREMDTFYRGFCNKTIWPLFHYFPVYTSYSSENWEQYIAVNETFARRVLEVYEPGDMLWIHDYHLMLLPGMIRRLVPDAAIGFFLHIPFPAFDVFRLLPSPWRRQILEGLYGADLIGFHTHDYRNYFLHSAARISGIIHRAGNLVWEGREIRADSFPMGIDYRKYHEAAHHADVARERKKIRQSAHGSRLVLSIDRQDYSKGILNRLRGYAYFLEKHPRWHGKVSLMLIVVPSRIGVDQYQSIKSKIDELVGSINGQFGTLKWTPVFYQYRSLSFAELIALYNTCDVALVTPLRDGMNLVAKEYIAARTRYKGVLILSEMAGAADELAESIIINPNNIEEIGDSLAQALKTPVKEQAHRLRIMQKRISSYDLFDWADEFLSTFKKVRERQKRWSSRTLGNHDLEALRASFRNAASRTLFLDYDGTLVPFKGSPEDARPGKALLRLLSRLGNSKNTDLILISGRDRETLEKWFGRLPVHLIAEHGLFIRERNKKWKLRKPVRKQWMKKIMPVLRALMARLPGSFVEEKEYTLVFHYRRADAETASTRVHELLRQLSSLIDPLDIQVIPGNKIVEIRTRGIDKGLAARHWLTRRSTTPHFILAAGDDTTDEDLFRAMPGDAITIKVGAGASNARHSLRNPAEVIRMLESLAGR